MIPAEQWKLHLAWLPMISAEQWDLFIAWLLYFELEADAERGLDPCIRREVSTTFRRFRRWAVRKCRSEQ